MVETTTDPNTYNFVGRVGDVQETTAEAVETLLAEDPETSTPQAVETPSTEDIETVTAEVVKILPIAEDTAQILLSVEGNIKELLTKLAEREEIGWGIESNPEEFKHLPSSITGVITYYVLRGIEQDFGFRFERDPKCLKRRGLSKDEKKVAEKKRLLTRDQKNELISKTEMNYYKDKISSGEITVEGAMSSIRDAFEKIQEFEKIGYILPHKKADYPYWVNKLDHSSPGGK